MRTARPWDLALVAAAVVGVCAVAFAATLVGHARPLEVLAVGVLVVAVVTAVLLRGLEDLARGLLITGVGTSSWNAVSFGGLKPSHATLAMAALLLAGLAAVSRTRLHVPAWVWVLGGAIVLVAFLTLVRPPSTGYFSARFVDDSGGLVDVPRLGLDLLGLSGVVEAAQWLVPVVALPVALCLALPRRPRLATVLADAWVVGAAASALVALTDEMKLTAISASLLPHVDVGGRQAGLSVQPNHVGVAVAIAAPLAVWRLAHGGRTARAVATVALLVMAGGLVVSESRGGLVAAVLGALVLLVIDPTARRALAPVAVGTIVLGTVFAVLQPGAIGGAATSLRLAGADSATASDAIRSSIAAQAVDDFLYSPWHGIGLEIAVQGHSIFLQLLAAGGVLLLLGFVLAFAGMFTTAWRERAVQDGLGQALAVCTATWLAVGTIENQLTDVFLYVPFALTAGLAAVRATAQPGSSPDLPVALSEPVLEGTAR